MLETLASPLIAMPPFASAAPPVPFPPLASPLPPVVGDHIATERAGLVATGVRHACLVHRTVRVAAATSRPPWPVFDVVFVFGLAFWVAVKLPFVLLPPSADEVAAGGRVRDVSSSTAIAP